MHVRNFQVDVKQIKFSDKNYSTNILIIEEEIWEHLYILRCLSTKNLYYYPGKIDHSTRLLLKMRKTDHSRE